MTENSGNGYVTRDSLFANPIKRRFADETVDGFGKFRMRSLTAGEQNKLNRVNYDKRGAVIPERLLQSNSRLIVACIVDADGNPVFADEDVKLLLEMDAKVIERVVGKCSSHCGFADEDAEKN